MVHRSTDAPKAVLCRTRSNHVSGDSSSNSVTGMRAASQALAVLLAFVVGVAPVSAITSQWQEITQYSQENYWPLLSPLRATAIRTERDISANVSVAYQVVPGIDAKTVLFEDTGYNDNSLQSLRTLLNVGIQSLVLDLYYYEGNSQWLMCPPETIYNKSGVNNQTVQVQCNSANFNLTSVVSTLNDFLTVTNNNLNTNIFFLLLRLHPFILPHSNISIPRDAVTSNITSLSTSLSSISKVVSPLSIDNNQLPTVNQLLFKLGLRVFPIIVSNNLPSNTTYSLSDDQFTLFTSSSALNARTTTNDSIVEQFNMIDMDFQEFNNVNLNDCSFNPSSKLSFTFDSNANPFSLQDYKSSISCAYSPIINHRFDNLSHISNFLDRSSWAWSAYQPTLADIDELQFANLLNNFTNLETTDDNDNDSEDDDGDNDEYVNRCAVISKIGWIATACDRKLPYFCQNQLNSTDIIVFDYVLSYSKATAACSALEGHYTLATPRNVFEQQHLISLIPNGKEFVWIDLNSLSSSNCWVVGPDTNCPYQRVVSTHIFVKLITPSSTMAGLLIILLIMLQFHRLPVHKNRKSWKRKINEILKNEYEGVPS